MRNSRGKSQYDRAQVDLQRFGCMHIRSDGTGRASAAVRGRRAGYMLERFGWCGHAKGARLSPRSYRGVAPQCKKKFDGRHSGSHGDQAAGRAGGRLEPALRVRAGSAPPNYKHRFVGYKPLRGDSRARLWRPASAVVRPVMLSPSCRLQDDARPRCGSTAGQPGVVSAAQASSEDD